MNNNNNNNNNNQDCLYYLSKTRIRSTSSNTIHLKYRDFELNDYDHDTFILNYVAFYQILKLCKRKEIRIMKDHYMDFAKKCMYQSSSGNVCILSLRAGYVSKSKECVLRFEVKDCYCLPNINEKFANGFVVKSNEPVIIWELGDCVEAKLCKATMKDIENNAQRNSKLFDFQK